MSVRKQQDKIIARALNEMELTSTTDRECNIMVIKTLTGLEESGEDLSETHKRDEKH